MEYDPLVCQHDQLMQATHELALAGEALAASLSGDETEIPAPTAYQILTNLMDTLIAMSRTTQTLRARLVASLCSTRIILTDSDFATGETRDPTKSVLAADAAILSSATSLELAERCLSAARNAIAGQMYEGPNTYGRTTRRDDRPMPR